MPHTWMPARAMALVTLWLLVAGVGFAFAQDTGSPGTPPAPQPAGSDSVARDSAQTFETPSAAAVGISGADRIAEIRAGFTPENRRYSRIRQTLGFVSPIYDIVIALVLLFSGLSAWMRDVAHARFKRRYPRVLVYLALYIPISLLLTFRSRCTRVSSSSISSGSRTRTSSSGWRTRARTCS